MAGNGATLADAIIVHFEAIALPRTVVHCAEIRCTVVYGLVVCLAILCNAISGSIGSARGDNEIQRGRICIAPESSYSTPAKAG